MSTQKADELQKDYEKLIRQCRDMARLPIDEWIAAIDKAEIVAPFIDPTMFMKYMHSDKPKILNKLMVAALTVKRAYEEVEPMLMKLFMEEIEHAQTQEQETSEKS